MVFPTLDGLVGILPNHEPMVTILVAGEIKFSVNGQWRYVAVSDGYIEMADNKVTVLADSVELPEEIDIKRAQAAKQRAEERLRQKESIREFYHTQAALNRAMNRLKVSSKHFKE
jgi:F-type H+-transporting ATPase subunit epsilon